MNYTWSVTEAGATNICQDLEDYSLTLKVLLAVISIIFMIFCLVAVYALNNSKHTPFSARFMSSGLITFDALAVIIFSVRKFVTSIDVNSLFQAFGVYFNFVAYEPIGAMSFERLLIFYSPHFYMKHVTTGRIKAFVFTFWLAITCSYFYVRFGICYLNYHDATLYDTVGKRCNDSSFLYFGILIFATLFASVACYVKIFLILRTERFHFTNKPISLKTTANILHKYKSTSLVFAYLRIVVITSLAYLIVIFIDPDVAVVRVVADVTQMVNCMLDPFIYVLWYKECRLEIFKLMSRLFPSLESRTHVMTLEVYSIVSVEKFNKQTENT